MPSNKSEKEKGLEKLGLGLEGVREFLMDAVKAAIAHADDVITRLCMGDHSLNEFIELGAAKGLLTQSRQGFLCVPIQP